MGFAYSQYHSGQSGKGTGVLSCGNGTTNYPTCDMCPSNKSLVGGNCVQNCTNTATNPPLCSNQTVMVSGTAQSVGAFTSAINVYFCNQTYYNGVCYGKLTSSGVNNGLYQLSLANNSTWYIEMRYASSFGVQGTCDGGVLSLETSGTTYTFDVRC